MRTRLAVPISPTDHVRGASPRVPDCVSVVVYGAYDDENSAHAHRLVMELVERTPALRYVHRHFAAESSLDAWHPAIQVEAYLAARQGEAGRADADGVSFWALHERMLDALQARPGTDGRVAATPVLTSTFTPTALAAGRARVTRDVRSARASRVRRAPAIFVDAEPYLGAWWEPRVLAEEVRHRLARRALGARPHAMVGGRG